MYTTKDPACDQLMAGGVPVTREHDLALPLIGATAHDLRQHPPAASARGYRRRASTRILSPRSTEPLNMVLPRFAEASASKQRAPNWRRVRWLDV